MKYISAMVCGYTYSGIMFACEILCSVFTRFDDQVLKLPSAGIEARIFTAIMLNLWDPVMLLR